VLPQYVGFDVCDVHLRLLQRSFCQLSTLPPTALQAAGFKSLLCPGVPAAAQLTVSQHIPSAWRVLFAAARPQGPQAPSMIGAATLPTLLDCQPVIEVMQTLDCLLSVYNSWKEPRQQQ
jgi:hypothetical protein